MIFTFQMLYMRLSEYKKIINRKNLDAHLKRVWAKNNGLKVLMNKQKYNELGIQMNLHQMNLVFKGMQFAMLKKSMISLAHFLFT